MSSLPIERSDNTTENNIILQHYNQPHESDRTEDSDVNQHKPEKPKKTKDQSPITFYCDFHKKVFKLAPQDVFDHFKIHEHRSHVSCHHHKHDIPQKRHSTKTTFHKNDIPQKRHSTKKQYTKKRHAKKNDIPKKNIPKKQHAKKNDKPKKTINPK